MPTRRSRLAALLSTLPLAGCSWLLAHEDLREGPEGLEPPAFREIEVSFDHRWDDDRSHPFTGAAVLDVEGDGRYEVFVGGGEGQDDALLGYRDGALVDRIQGTGLSSVEATHGATSVDLDQDGAVDLLVARPGGVTFYRNQGGRFEARSIPLELGPEATPFSVAAADYDRDGDVDLYVSVFVASGSFRSAVFNDPTHARANVLLRNEGEGRFLDVTTPVSASRQNTFASGFVDLDGDGWQDLVLSQNTGVVEILRNRGGRPEHGGFEDVPVDSGYGFWMSLTIGDVDSDGDQDLFFSNVGSSIPRFPHVGGSPRRSAARVGVAAPAERGRASRSPT